MSDLRPLVERQLDRIRPPSYDLDEFRRRHDRGERNGRIAAAVVAIVIASSVVAAAAWVTQVDRSVPVDQRPLPIHVGGKIVFNEFLGQYGQDYVASYTVNADGSDLTQVGPAGTTYCGDNDDPWSPDGSEIACIVFRPDLTTATATMEADGSNYAVIQGPRVPRVFGCTGWSPDGARLLCPDTSDGVFTVAQDGTDLVRLTPRSAASGPSGYTADGLRAYFTAEDSSEFRTLYSVPADGSGRSAALSPPNVSVHDNANFDGVSADSSPDGSKVVFAGDLSRTRGALYVATVDGSAVKTISTPGVNPTSAQWSPDGAWIAFTGASSTPGGYAEVYVVHPDGHGLREVTAATDGCAGLNPVWSPDSTALLFQSACYSGSVVSSTGLEIASVDGSAPSKVVDLNGLTSYGWGSEGTR
jgi:Tol biopolymer transport system component